MSNPDTHGTGHSPAPPTDRARGAAATMWRRIRTDPYATAAAGIIVCFCVLAYFAPLIANDKPLFVRWQGRSYFPAVADLFPLHYIDLYPDLRAVDFSAIRGIPGSTVWYPPIPHSPLKTSLDRKLRPPSRAHWLGTDDLGRDVMSRMVHGTAVSLKIGLAAVLIAAMIGVTVGALAGFYGGIIDLLLSRSIEIFMCFPFLFLVLAIVAFLPPSTTSLMVVIGITRWTAIARYTRAEFMRIRNQDYAFAARALGMANRRIIFRHILPNALTPVVVASAFGIANAILIEAALSFLGMGIQPPNPSWGGILAQAREYIDIAWWLAVIPGVAIFLTVAAFNIMGEALRDAGDPRTLPSRQ